MNRRVALSLPLAGVALLGIVAAYLAWPQPVFSQDPLAGSQVFGTRGCAQCHAVGGVGGKIGPDLRNEASVRSFYDLAAAMWNHLPKMAAEIHRLRVPRPRMDAREANDLVAFLATVDYFDAPGNPKTGAKLFLDKRCVVCHQVAGTGGVVGPNLDHIIQTGSPIALAAAMWNHGPAMAEAMRARGITRPVFTGRELNDLIGFLKAHARGRIDEPIYALPGRAEAGRALFAEKQCAACHGVRGEGGRSGPALYNRKAPQSLMQFAAAMWNKEPSMMRAMKAAGIMLPQLTAEEMANIVAYLYSVNYFADSGNPARGRDLMTAKGCSDCHTVAGKAARAGSIELRRLNGPAAFVSGLWNHLAFLEKPDERAKVQWPLLTPEEAADLVAFLQRMEG